MTTQDYPSIPVFYDQDQDNVRLLELPPEICDLITSGSNERLWLKSARVPAINETNATPAHTVLCTRDATYQLRQVQTSNTVLVMKPVTIHDSGSDSPQPFLTAFAMCTNTLELQNQKNLQPTESKSAVEYLAENLLVYDGAEFPRTIPATDKKARSAVFSDIPFSQNECEQAWNGRMAFEWQGGCWYTAPELLLQIWTRLMNHTTAQGINLAAHLPQSAVEEVIEEMELPEEICDAFCLRLRRLSHQAATTKSPINLERKLTIDWIGEILVSAPTANGKEDGVWKVLETWQNLLPEEWRNDITTKDVLALRFKVRGATSGQNEDGALEELQNGVKRPATTSIKRNWHEKFKRSRA